jgi:hypothetical protein
MLNWWSGLSGERKLSMVLAIMLIVLGLIAIPYQASREDGSVAVAVAFVGIGIVAIGVLSRRMAVREEKAAIGARLDKISADVGDDSLRAFAAQARQDPHEQLGRIGSQPDTGPGAGSAASGA